ncbi:MAG: hypothetical protein IH999_11425 [Proteobacteria bacterium]|nr:hypothetical protein [Pseudomonadota bacterium]
MTQGNGRKPDQEAPGKQTPPLPLEKKEYEEDLPLAEESDVGEGDPPTTPQPGAED